MRRIPIFVAFDGRMWRLASADGRLAGVFVDWKSALRQARAEADAHPTYVCAAGEGPHGDACP